MDRPFLEAKATAKPAASTRSQLRTLLLRNHHNAASRYSGTFRFRLRDAIRATTAAPTVFVPLVQDGLVYCDGSLFANNPTAIALHEARSLFPHVPVECVVSVGTVRAHAHTPRRPLSPADKEHYRKLITAVVEKMGL